jgi:hypothetical protein
MRGAIEPRDLVYDMPDIRFHETFLRRVKCAVSEIGLARRAGLSRENIKAATASCLFDERFYLRTYPDAAAAKISPLAHYLIIGRFEKRRPSLTFDPFAYIEANPEVAKTGMEPFLHYLSVGRAADLPLSKAETIPPRPELTREIATGTSRLILFLTPGYDLRSGGVLSIAAIYNESRGLADIHGAKVALCATPGDDPLFLKYSWFDNDCYFLDLYAVLRRCQNLDYLQIHLPEYAVNMMGDWLELVASSLLRNVACLHLNILLQNIDLIQGQKVDRLKRFGKVTATTAHEAYSNSETRQKLGIPIHRLSVRVGPELYNRSDYSDKKPILVVSHDEHPLKQEVLAQIARAIPELDIRVVKNLSYEEYKSLVSRAKWSLTFGEGLDGYFLETVFSGGNSFAVFNDRFFTPAFAALETVYPSWEVLMQKIVLDLRRLDEPRAYHACWRQAYDLLSDLYSTEKFRENLRLFYRGEYTFP